LLRPHSQELTRNRQGRGGVYGLNMLEVRNLTKRYSAIPAVLNVSFNIRPGQILGYLGPNGSGKSTTVKMLTGLLEPSDGEIFFRGENVLKNRLWFSKRCGRGRVLTRRAELRRARIFHI